MLAVLRSGGLEISAAPTISSTASSTQALQAITDGCDTIFAGGGDGTIHDILQAVVGTPAALGIIPFGTANALAHDLKIPFSAEAAARSALNSQPMKIAAGRISFQDFSGQTSSRYFTVAAGVGVDAHLFYKLNAVIKGHLGMLAYYMKATRLWLTHDMRTFRVRRDSSNTEATADEVSQLLAVRIAQFGGILRELAPEAALARNDLRLVLFKTSNRLLYLAYVLRGLLGRRWRVPGVELANAKQVVCEAIPSAKTDRRIYVEVDGELVGTLPATISIVPEAFTLLVPN